MPLDPNRKNYLTASNVGAILGQGKYKTPKSVLNDMVKAYNGTLVYKDNPAMAHGRNNEHKGVAYASEFMAFVGTGDEQIFVTKDFLGATPDGLSKDGTTVLEIKAPFSQDYTAHNYELYMPEYYAQMQVQMYVTGANRAMFVVVQADGDVSHIFVPYNSAWMNENYPKLQAFFAEFQKAIIGGNPDDRKLAERLAFIQKQIAELEAEYDQVKEKLVANNPTGGHFGNVVVSVVDKKGSVDYRRIVKEVAPETDLEAYRGKGSSYIKVTVNEQ
jgi:putative phage-type endonuclease